MTPIDFLQIKLSTHAHFLFPYMRVCLRAHKKQQSARGNKIERVEEKLLPELYRLPIHTYYLC